MTNQEFSFRIHKTLFFGQSWTAKKTKAVVVIVHGMGEHSGRYHHVADVFTKEGFSVVAFDHFGHGKTEGKRGHNPNFEAVLDSIQYTIDKAKELFPELPIFLYGHSMGGNAIINYLLSRTHEISAAIASSAFLRLAFEPPKIKLRAGKILQRIAPSVTMGNELNAEDISRDPKAVDAYVNDPLVHNKISPNFSLTFIDKGKWAIDHAHQLKIPIFLIHGTEDHIIDYGGSEDFAEGAKKATLKLYEGGYHELHHDLCKEEAIQDIADWLQSQLQ